MKTYCIRTLQSVRLLSLWYDHSSLEGVLQACSFACSPSLKHICNFFFLIRLLCDFFLNFFESVQVVAILVHLTWWYEILNSWGHLEWLLFSLYSGILGEYVWSCLVYSPCQHKLYSSSHLWRINRRGSWYHTCHAADTFKVIQNYSSL